MSFGSPELLPTSPCKPFLASTIQPRSPEGVLQLPLLDRRTRLPLPLLRPALLLPRQPLPEPLLVLLLFLALLLQEVICVSRARAARASDRAQQWGEGRPAAGARQHAPIVCLSPASRAFRPRSLRRSASCASHAWNAAWFLCLRSASSSWEKAPTRPLAALQCKAKFAAEDAGVTRCRE